jgi:hypothetical protein
VASWLLLATPAPRSQSSRRRCSTSGLPCVPPVRGGVPPCRGATDAGSARRRP